MEVIKFHDFMSGAYKVESITMKESAIYESYKYLSIVIAAIFFGTLVKENYLSMTFI